jgi:excisionase family DNA binding protein
MPRGKSKPIKIPAKSQRLTLTVDEAAKALGINRGLAYSLARSGEIPSIRLGKRLLVIRAAFEKLFQGAA